MTSVPKTRTIYSVLQTNVSYLLSKRGDIHCSPFLRHLLARMLSFTHSFIHSFTKPFLVLIWPIELQNKKHGSICQKWSPLTWPIKTEKQKSKNLIIYTNQFSESRQAYQITKIKQKKTFPMNFLLKVFDVDRSKFEMELTHTKIESKWK